MGCSLEFLHPLTHYYVIATKKTELCGERLLLHLCAVVLEYQPGSWQWPWTAHTSRRAVAEADTLPPRHARPATRYRPRWTAGQGAPCSGHCTRTEGEKNLTGTKYLFF